MLLNLKKLVRGIINKYVYKQQRFFLNHEFTQFMQRMNFIPLTNRKFHW